MPCSSFSILTACLAVLLVLLSLTVPCAGHYTAESVIMQPLEETPSSGSVTGSLCGQRGCSEVDDGVTDALITFDRRALLMTAIHSESIVVQSPAGKRRIPLGCQPTSMAQLLPDRRIAVTCDGKREVLLVSLESTHPPTPPIPTEKNYRHVAAHPLISMLLVVGDKTSIDVINLQGRVVQKLVDDSSQWGVTAIFSLTTAHDGHVLVTGAGSKKVHRIPLSPDSSSPRVDTLSDDFSSHPMDTAVDRAGNVFVVLQDGAVMVRTSERHYRQLWAGGEKRYWRCYIALHSNRLLLVTRPEPRGGAWESIVSEYQLENSVPAKTEL